MTYTTVPDDRAAAAANRAAILHALRRDHFALLPPGTTFIDEGIMAGPDLGPFTIQGVGMEASALQQIGHVWPNNFGLYLSGLGYKDLGEGAVDLPEGALTAPYRGAEDLAGQLVYVHRGPDYGDPLTGEYRRVVAQREGEVTLDRPLRRTYRLGRVATGRPVVGVTLRDFTIAQPEHPGAYKLLVRRAYGLRCERVRFGRPGEAPAGWGCAETGDVALADCDSSGAPVGFNTSHDLEVLGGRYLSFVGEEACLDGRVERAVIAPGGRPFPGVRWYLGSERLSLRDVRIEGAGAPAEEGGSHAPLAVYGRQNRLEGVECCGSLPPYGNGLGGDGLYVSGLRCDLEAWLTQGTAVTLRDSSAPVWKLLAGTRGVVRDCQGLFVHDPADWDDREAPADGATMRRVGLGAPVPGEAARLLACRRPPVIDWAKVRPGAA